MVCLEETNGAVIGAEVVVFGQVSGGFCGGISLGRSLPPSSVLNWVSLVSLKSPPGLGSQITPLKSCAGVDPGCFGLHPQNRRHRESPFSGCMVDSHQS